LSNSSNNNDILITSSGINGGTVLETQGDNGFIQIKTVNVQLDLTNTLATFTDSRTGTTSVGLEYADDYSTNFTSRSLVDKGYVTGLTSSIQINKLAVAIVNANYTATTTNHVLLVNTAAARTITLPASPVDGQVYHIKDKSGNALTNNITIAGNGNDIDGAGSATINTDYGSLYVVYSSTEGAWFTLAYIS
jgi:hypothetical protein